jgi:4-amino-4-deoxy-L-arabinose transferase-like glycosyltransferase
MLDFLRFHESHPPLFYALMRAWLAVAGPSDAAALVPPVLFGALLAPCLYAVGARVFSRRTGMIAALLAAVAPLLVEYSAQVRPYSLLPLLCLLSTYFLWRGATASPSDGFRFWLGYVGATWALLLTHNWGWVVLAAQWLVVLFGLALLAATARLRTAARPAWAWLAAQAAVALGVSPWLPSLALQVRQAGLGPAPAGIPASEPLLLLAETAVSLPRTFADSPLAAPGWIAFACVAALVLLAIRAAAFSDGPGSAPTDAAAAAGLPAERFGLLLFAGVAFGAVAVATVLSQRSNLILPRCLLTVVPCLLLVMARGLAALSPASNERVSLPTTAATGVLVTVLLLLGLLRYGEIKSNAREVAAQVAARVGPDDLVVIAPEWIASGFNRYFKAGNPQINFPAGERLGAVRFDNQRARMADPDAFRRARARLAEARREGRTVWLVMDTNDLVDRVPAADEIPAAFVSAGHVGVVRANQLRGFLGALYGPPDASALPPDRRPGDEILTAMRFGPPFPGSTSGSTSGPGGRP